MIPANPVVTEKRSEPVPSCRASAQNEKKAAGVSEMPAASWSAFAMTVV
jgi:hypothetical protein